jgi:hypothetical protein
MEWLNSRGETVRETASGGLMVLNSKGQRVSRPARHASDAAGAKAAELGRLRAQASLLRVRLDQFVADHYPAALIDPVRRELDRVLAAIAQAEASAPMSGNLAGEVARELVKHKGAVAAYVDETSGSVKAFMLPTPPAVMAPAVNPLMERMNAKARTKK